jgi:T4 RnlA family RNA ligase
MLLEFSHKVLFKKLVALKADHHPVFDYKDYDFKDTKYRIFNYNLANYPSFTLDAALECRGATFEIDSEGNFVELVSLPMQKFFNYLENPFTEGLENEKILLAMDKQDGSLISTFLQDGEVYLKSKGSFESQQAQDANILLHKLPKLKSTLLHYENLGFTVNLEYTAPDNQIVLQYEKPGLAILNVRNRNTGEYLSFSDINADEEYLVDISEQYHGLTLSEFADSVFDLTEIEGFVILTESGHWVKFKTNWYCHRHNTVSKFSPFTKKGRKEIIMSVFDEKTDDIRQLFNGNKFALNVLSIAEQFVVDYLQDVEKSLDYFHSNFADLEGKEFYDKVVELYSDDNIKSQCILRSKKQKVNVKEQLINAAQSSKIEKYNDLMSNLKE